jgi:hypothetical protein
MPIIPVAPSISASTSTGFTITKNVDGNSGSTHYAFRVVSGSVTKYVDGTGLLQNTPIFLLVSSIVVTNASPNTTYSVSLSAADDALGTNQTAYGPASSVVTLAALPIVQPFKNIFSTTVTTDWSPNSNPAGTNYFVELSTDPGFLSGVLNSGYVITEEHKFNGLLSNTTYYARVKARNSSLLETGFVDLGSILTSSGPDTVKGIHVFNLIAERGFLIKWSSNLETNISNYKVYRSPSPTDIGAFEELATVNANVNSYVDRVPFTFGIVFYYIVTAVDDGGNESSLHLTTPVNDNTFHSFEEQPFVTSTLITQSDFINDETPSGLIDSNNTVFTTQFGYRTNSLEVYLNGVKLIRVIDFNEGTSTQFTLVDPPDTGDLLRVNYIRL